MGLGTGLCVSGSIIQLLSLLALSPNSDICASYNWSSGFSFSSTSSRKSRRFIWLPETRLHSANTIGDPSAWSMVSASPHRMFLWKINRTASRHCSLAWSLTLALYSLFQMSNSLWRHSAALSGIMSTPYKLVTASTEYRS